MTLVFTEATAAKPDTGTSDSQNAARDDQRALATIADIAREASEDPKLILGNRHDQGLFSHRGPSSDVSNQPNVNPA